MAYREVRAMDIEQVIRRWTAGEAIRAIARTTGLDRNTVRGLIRLARKTGLKAMMNLASASNNARMMSRKSGFIGTLELPLFQTQLPGQQDTFRRRQLSQKLPLSLFDFHRRSANSQSNVSAVPHFNNFT